MKYILPKSAVKAIADVIEGIFNRAKAKYLGKPLPKKDLHFDARGFNKPVEYREDLSLGGVFDAGAKSEGMSATLALKQSIEGVAAKYMDAYQEMTTARAVDAVQSHLHDAELVNDVDTDKVLGEALKEVFGKMKNDVIRMVDTETNHAKNLGIVDAISKMTASLGITDPTVVFIGPNDKHTCKECERLFFTDGVNPRPWKMSELKHGYGKRGDFSPSVSVQHPHCRHALASVLPGYGFKSGSMQYVEPGYDYYAEYHK